MRNDSRPKTVHEAAEALGLSPHTIRAWVAQRRIAHIRLGRAMRIPASEIIRILPGQRDPSVAPKLTDSQWKADSSKIAARSDGEMQ